MMDKTYVAEGVLTDYSSGMVVVKAKNIAEARKIVRKEFSEENAEEIIANLVYLKNNTIAYVYGGG